MSEPAQAHETGCCGTCEACREGRPEPAAGDAGLAGWRFGLAAAGVFLFPLATAFLGARWGGADMTRQALGGLAGLAAGAGCAALVYRAMRHGGRRSRGSTA